MYNSILARRRSIQVVSCYTPNSLTWLAAVCRVSEKLFLEFQKRQQKRRDPGKGKGRGQRKAVKSYLPRLERSPERERGKRARPSRFGARVGSNPESQKEKGGVVARVSVGEGGAVRLQPERKCECLSVYDVVGVWHAWHTGGAQPLFSTRCVVC